ncbi:Hypothetical predicted protein [Mytilus galloprovincialis]|uniref:Uncharacterized protein n=1 Tax=Mytilus galloprovincialis TaxID=29158 RepID=A0A8B6GIG8_MYTGA|nr:Hypothetical predicted protein [Mytilus galloprovincialis]
MVNTRLPEDDANETGPSKGSARRRKVRSIRNVRTAAIVILELAPPYNQASLTVD